MQINLIRLKGVVTELRGIKTELSRLADCWELQLAHEGIHIRPPKADTSGPEPTIEYTDEEMDWARENIEIMKRDDQRKTDEENNTV